MVYIIILLIITNALSIVYILRLKSRQGVKEEAITDLIAEGVGKGVFNGLTPLLGYLEKLPVKWIDESGNEVYERKAGRRIERRKIKK